MTTKRFDPTDELRPMHARDSDEVLVRTGERGDSPLAFDVYRRDDDLCIDFDVPGVHPDAIHVSLESQVLAVVAERELVGAGVEVIERGRPHGSFEQRLVLPGHWDLTALRAEYANGVLSVRAPRRGPVTAREIPVVVRSAATARKASGELGDEPGETDVDKATVGTAA